MVHLDLPKNVLVSNYHQRDRENLSFDASKEDPLEESKLIRAADAINRSTNPIFF